MSKRGEKSTTVSRAHGARCGKPVSQSSDGEWSSSGEGGVAPPDRVRPSVEKTQQTQFSVTSSDNTGLRMKIAIPRSTTAVTATKSMTATTITTTTTTTGATTNSPARRDKVAKQSKGVAAAAAAAMLAKPRRPRGRPRKRTISSSSSSSICSECDSVSDSEAAEPTAVPTKRGAPRTVAKAPAKQVVSVSPKKILKVKPQSSSSSDCDSSDEPNARRTSRQPRRRSANVEVKPTPPPLLPPPLAPPAPTASSTPIKRRPGRPPKKPPQPMVVPEPPQPRPVKEVRLSLVDGGSSSDNEAFSAVSAAIKRVVESKSDSEQPPKAILSPIQYTSSLLRDFVEKTEKLGQQEANVIVPDQTAKLPQAEATQMPAVGTVKRKRGRPPKKTPVEMTASAALTTAPASSAIPLSSTQTNRLTQRVKLSSSGSPDSGIVSSINQSPAHESPRLGRKLAATSSTVTAVNTATTRTQPSLTSNKININALEKTIYATERVLYPPRNVKRGRPPLNKNHNQDLKPPPVVHHDSASGSVDPVWKQIDINKKFRRPSTTNNGYKSDGEIMINPVMSTTPAAAAATATAGGSQVICSKVLAAHCGYASDYGAVRQKQRHLSGYRSDYSTKSRKSVGGYRSDYSVKGAASCGYRSDCSVRHRKKVRRKRRPKQPQMATADSIPSMERQKQQAAFNEQDILQLAGLSLGNSSEEDDEEEEEDDESNGTEATLNVANQKKVPLDKNVPGGKSILSRMTTGSASFKSSSFTATPVNFAKFDKHKFNREFVLNYRTITNNNRALQSLQNTKKASDHAATKAKPSLRKPVEQKPDIENYNHFETFDKVLPILELKSKASAKSVRSRRSSAVSRCSSRSASSRHPSRRHRRKRLKSKSETAAAAANPKLLDKIKLELDELIQQFSTACQIIEASAKEKVPKAMPNDDAVAVAPAVVAPVAVVVAAEPKEAGKPAAKRGPKKRKGSENNVDGGGSVPTNGGKRRNKKVLDANQSPDDHKLPLKKRHYLLEEKGNLEAVVKEEAKQPPRSVTPKKRHFLEAKEPKPATTTATTSTTTATSATAAATSEEKKPDSSQTQPKSQKRPTAEHQTVQKKKRLEGLVTKMQTSPKKQSSPKSATASNGSPKTVTKDKDKERNKQQLPPPGVFEPSVDLELQIPMSTILIPGLLGAMKALDSPNSSLKRKRKKINRTGFPTVKKKKKTLSKVSPLNTSGSSAETVAVAAAVTMPAEMCPIVALSEKCDRVPKDGEATSNFIERNVKPRLSVISLEKLQEPDALKRRTLRARDSSQESIKRPRDDSQDSVKLSERVKRIKCESQKKAKEEKKLEQPVVVVADEVVAPKKQRGRKKLTEATVVEVKKPEEPKIERSKREVVLKKPAKVPERRISLLEEISPHKRQSIRNLAKTLMQERPEVVVSPLVVPQPEPKALKIDPKRRRMTVAVVNLSERVSRQVPAQKAIPKAVRPPRKEETATEQKDILPATSATDLDQEPLPALSEDEEDTDRDSVPPRTDTPSSELSDRSAGKKVPKKKFLSAGLFSDHYKDGGGGGGSGNGEKSNKLVKEEAQPLLPPPPYCERFFRQTPVDYQLPYDLWWAHDNLKLPGRDTIASWNFKKIRTNVYIDVKANPTTDLPSCSCKPNSGCVEDCLNRMVYTECNPDTCPCADRCQNTKIQRHGFAPGIERFMTEKKGWGVRTKQAIPKSRFIIEYLGEVVTEREFKERMATLYVRDTHHYCLHLDGELVIDGHRMGSDCRFVNHSCTPNCEMQKWSVNGLSRMCLFALRDIKPGEELTYDYNFALYNPSEGQPCKCDTKDCRGVIGGKSQRLAKAGVMMGEPVVLTGGSSGGKDGPRDGGEAAKGRTRKRQAKKNQSQNTGKVRATTPLFQVPTHKESAIIRESHCFLMRNLVKVRRQKEALPLIPTAATASSSSNAELGARRTRGLKSAEANDVHLAQLRAILLKMVKELMEVKDLTTDPAKRLVEVLEVPSKKKCPTYHEVVKKPIEIQQVEVNVDKWIYKTVKAFDDDMLRLFSNAFEYFATESPERKTVEQLQGMYNDKKRANYTQLLQLFNDKDFVKPFEPVEINELELKPEPNEDIIRCICGLFKDEGLMIECSRCQVWQHAECTKADIEAENYLCERCEPRVVDLEIPLEEFTDEGYRYYLSLLRGDLQIRQNDTVYVLRDIPLTPDKNNPDETAIRKHTYETIGHIDYGDCDIFRVERLWKDTAGKRFVFGHHYLRPHETFHEPSRKFYPNEVIRVPLFEVVPIELIMDRCWVLDTTTYCKGRPVDSAEEHVYICELRVDKTARLFYKIPKNSNPVCTKSYAFKKFKQKLKISRSYAPHDLGTGGAASSTGAKPGKKRKESDVPIASRKNSTSIVQLRPPPPKTLIEKRQRLEGTLSKLMDNQRKTNPNFGPEIDLSYLLTGRRRRMAV